jgi:two-component system, chemotaxis family, sensor histidine kinase and response regulator WspE
MSGPGYAVDGALLDLFRTELETHTGALSEGLLALETAAPASFESLLRAAHSIKGAARVVGVELATRLAHALEDRLVAVRERQESVSADEVDVHLRAVDLFNQLAASTSSLEALASWHASHGPGVEALIGELTAMASGAAARATKASALPPAPAVGAAAPLAAPPAPPPAPAATPVPTSAGPASAALPATTSPATPVSAPAPAPRAAERVIRVAATNIERLVGLAGESLVETRQLHPFVESLRIVMDKQSALTRLIDELAAKLQGAAEPEAVTALVATARARALECRQLVADRASDLDGSSRRLEDANSRLYREVLASRMRPFADGISGFPRMVRDLARDLGKKVQFDIVGEHTQVDRDVLEKLKAPLTHILRNSVDHGAELPAQRVAAGKPETVAMRLEARHRAGMLIITCSDDGRGIDVERLRSKVVHRGMVSRDVAERLSHAELLEFIFLPGVSTADSVTEISGRGVGLDVVQSFVQEIGGTVRVFSELGKGTRFQLQLPLTLSVIRALVVQIAGDPYALPLNRIERIGRVPRSQIRLVEGREFFPLDDQNIGLVAAHRLLGLEPIGPPRDEVSVVVVGDRTYKYGLAVDRFLGEHDLVVRPLDPRLGRVPDINAAAILNDGAPLLILDVEDVVRSIDKLLNAETTRALALGTAPAATRRRKRILVVDDSITVREVERQLLTSRGYEVVVAVDGADGWNTVRGGEFDLVVSDIDMPRMNGIELVRSIKQDGKLRSLPVVIVSYKDREEDRLRGLEAGADGYLTKSSFQDQTLIKTVERLIGEALA